MLTPSIERVRFGVDLTQTQWMIDWNCAGQGSDEWFTTEKGSQPHIKQATRVCNDSPVRLKCLEYGIEGDEWGVWGGVGQIARRRIAKMRAVVNPT